MSSRSTRKVHVAEGKRVSEVQLVRGETGDSEHLKAHCQPTSFRSRSGEV
jgi:hypothetical protein